MSGIVGHTAYAILGGLAAAQRKLPVVPVLQRHYASYLCGSYLGCDVQVLPAAYCIDTGQEVGFGSYLPEKSPLTGGEVRPWKLKFQGQEFTPRQVHELFYGRAHLVFGWSRLDRQHTLPWDHLADYLSLVVEDSFALYGPSERRLAYLFGWMTHIVGDSLIKSVHPGIDLHLLDGKYTPRNRPIQDLYTLHEVILKELRLDWRGLMADLVDTPVEEVQTHYMRVGEKRGQLAEDFPNAWTPGKQALLLHVLAENRRYQRIRNERLWKQYQLTHTKHGWQCDKELSERTGGLSYQEMLEAADKAGFRHALWQMGEAVADIFEQVVQRQPRLREMPRPQNLSWSDWTRSWRRDP